MTAKLCLRLVCEQAAEFGGNFPTDHFEQAPQPGTRPHIDTHTPTAPPSSRAWRSVADRQVTDRNDGGGRRDDGWSEARARG